MSNLKKRLNKSVFLDGDWCWDSHPFQVTDETKQMVLSNICFMLNQFIHCSAYENVIFCWVMHEQSIIDSILANIDESDCFCCEETIRSHLMDGIEAENRTLIV